MENIYFELRENGVYQYGVVENITKNTKLATVKKRISVEEDNSSIIIVDEIDGRDIDIVFDWTALDFDGGLDEDLIIVDEILEKAIVDGLEDKVVYTALSLMKKDSNLSISGAMIKSFDELTK